METIEILSEPERIRRRTAQEKIDIVPETLEPGAWVSAVALWHGVNANQVFGSRKQYKEGSLATVKAGESVVPASELAAAIKEIKELQRLLGKKALEIEILKEAVDWARSKNLIACSAVVVKRIRSTDWRNGRRARVTDDIRLAEEIRGMWRTCLPTLLAHLGTAASQSRDGQRAMHQRQARVSGDCVSTSCSCTAPVCGETSGDMMVGSPWTAAAPAVLR